MISESLIRRFGYSNKFLAEFLIESLTELGLEREAEMARNLHLNPGYSRVDFLESKADEHPSLNPYSIGKTSVAGRLMNLFSLSTRETFFDAIFRSKLLAKSRRPFVRVWRLRGHDE
jgi:hypothetical protein